MKNAFADVHRGLPSAAPAPALGICAKAAIRGLCRASQVAALALALPLAAHALCTSDGVPAPQAVMERFISADCADCWRDPATPAARGGVLALDWIVPGRAGEDAPLAAAQSRDALERLRELGRPVPGRSDVRTTLRQAPAVPVRAAQGEPFNDYIGTSITLGPAPAGAWPTWLLLVEELPAGTEGSPVARNLVRNAFRPDWRATGPGPWTEARPMQIHEGAQPRRLRLVALVQDARGRMRGITQTECRPGRPQ